MTTYYRIVDWDKHYEVDDRSHIWKPGKPFRQGTLEYLRIKARRDWNHRLLAMKELGDEVDELLWAAALGIFERLCLMVACEPRDLRAGGIIRFSNGQPATIEQMARMLRFKVQTMKKILGLLLDPEVQWIEAVPETSLATCQEPQEGMKGPGDPAITGAPGISGNSRSHVAYPDKSRTSQEKTKEKQEQEQEPLEPPEMDSDPKPWINACEQTPPRPGRRSPGLHDIYSLSGFDNVRLAFLRELRSTLGCDSNASNAAIINFERWVHQEYVGPHATHEERTAKLGIITGIARDCRKAIKPAAAFMQRVKDDLGYIPPTTGRLTEKSA